MKKNDIFLTPQRQSQFAIIFIILRFVKRILRQAWPLALALFLGRGGSSTLDTIELALTGLGIVGLVPSIISYYKFYFNLTDDELVINSGIFKKVRLNIPFERIQSVNFRQTFVHQFFKVTEVQIETAGSSQQETKIDALDIPTAERLRKRILERKNAVNSESLDSMEIVVDEEVQPVEKILELSPQELLRVGLAQNHLKPIGLLTGVIASFYFYSFTFDFDPTDFIREIYSFVESLSLVRLILFVAVLLAGSIVYSIISTVLRHYNLSFWRSGSKFQVVQGLFTRQEFAALDKKVQILNWGQNPFERLLGYYNIEFKQAISAEDGKRSSRFRIPGCSDVQVKFVRDAWLANHTEGTPDYNKVSSHLFWHGFYYQLFFFSLPIAALLYLSQFTQAILLIVVFVATVFLNWMNYKKKRYAISNGELYVGGGTLGLRHSLLPLYKVQDVRITANPYQWRRNLATLEIFTAAGAVKIPYIQESTAKSLLDQLIYHVEVSKKAWI